MDLPPFALERYFAPREFAARAHLSCSDCEALALRDLLADASGDDRAAYDGLRLGYTHARGSPPLRAAIAALYDHVAPDDVLACAPSEGVLLAMTTLLHPGDKVVVTMPAYQSLHDVARARGCDVVEWRPDPDDGWRFDPERLRALAAGARMIVVNFPHNPTGWLPTRDEWRTIVDVARAQDALLFSDEMYRLLEDDALRLPAAVDAYERGVTLSGLSKAYGAPGLRVGWLACRDRAALDKCAERKDWTTICGGIVDEQLALLVLRKRDAVLAGNRARVRASLQALATTDAPLAWTPPRAGCVALARLTTADGADAVCDALFADAGILLLPSTVFGLGDRHVRLGLGRAGFPDALAGFAAWARDRRLGA